MPRPASPPWRAEPFRAFFPLGVALGWVGIGHWLLYATGLSQTYSCLMHGLLQTQSFLMAFALGFLFTAVPRRTGSAPPSETELVAALALLASTAAALVAQAWLLAEVGYLATLALLLQFALRRFLGATAARRPPAAFVLIPIGILHGVVGGLLLIFGLGLGAPAYATALGALLIQQGVFLCFTTGVGGLVLPLMSGVAPPADLGSSPRETRRALAFAGAGAAILLSFFFEVNGWVRGAPLVRAAVVALALVGQGAWRPPVKPGFHRRLAWLAIWLLPLGLAASAIWPDYRVPALHVTFIGGFGLLTFAVATHVVLSHLGRPELALGRPPAIVATAVLLLLALLARLGADWTDRYFDHLGWAAGCWIAGTLVWLAFVGPMLLRPSGPPSDPGGARR